MGFLIILCNKCRQPSLANDDKKTRRCPYCGNLIRITRLNILSSAEDAETAKEILKNYKLHRRWSKEDKCNLNEYY